MERRRYNGAASRTNNESIRSSRQEQQDLEIVHEMDRICESLTRFRDSGSEDDSMSRSHCEQR